MPRNEYLASRRVFFFSNTRRYVYDSPSVATNDRWIAAKTFTAERWKETVKVIGLALYLSNTSSKI